MLVVSKWAKKNRLNRSLAGLQFLLKRNGELTERGQVAQQRGLSEGKRLGALPERRG